MDRFSSLTRAMTFDDRVKVRGSNNNDSFSPLKRSQTFIENREKSGLKNRSRSGSSLAGGDSEKFNIPDVIFRRHFNTVVFETKLLPHLNKNGLQLELEMENLQTHHYTNSEAVIVVDTFSTGAMLADALYKMGLKVICVLSGDLEGLLEMIPDDLEVKFAATVVYDTQIPADDAVQGVLDEVESLGYPVLAVFAGLYTTYP